MKIKIGLKVIWSGNILLPRAHFWGMGTSNQFRNYMYRIRPYITITKKNGR